MTEKLARIREHLRARAEALTARIDGPVSSEGIAEALGVVVVRRDIGDTGRCGGTLEKSEGAWRIVVQSRGGSRSAHRERFTIAHEIGHLLVESEFPFRPSGTREYWELEDACNEFASLLLLPARRLAGVVALKAVSPVEIARIHASIQLEALVSAEVAARRLVRCRPEPLVAGEIELSVDSSQAVSGKLRWCAEATGWAPGGRGVKIREGSTAWPLLQVATEPAQWVTKVIPYGASGEAILRRVNPRSVRFWLLLETPGIGACQRLAPRHVLS